MMGSSEWGGWFADRAASVAGMLDAVLVVPPPPLIRFGLRPAFRRIFPVLLAAVRRQVEQRPDGADGFESARLDEVGAIHVLAVAQENAEARRFALIGGHPHVAVEIVAVRRIPRQVPAHPLAEAFDVRQRRARDQRERGI